MSVATSSLLLALRRPLLDFADGVVPPMARAWLGKRFSPEANQPYLADSLSPSVVFQEGHPFIRAMRTVRGLYLIQWYGLPNQGIALTETTDAVVACYPPGTSLVTSDGNAVQVRDNPAPSQSEPREVNGRTLITITVPYECVTLTAQAA
jgi:hypothetical protein